MLGKYDLYCVKNKFTQVSLVPEILEERAIASANSFNGKGKKECKN